MEIAARLFSPCLTPALADRRRGMDCQPAILARTGHSRLNRQGYAHVLARYHAMGAVLNALWITFRLHFQPATIFTAIEPGLLGTSGIVPEPGRLFSQSRHPHDPLP